MKNKKVILSIASGYNYSQLKPFVETLMRTGYDGDLVLFVSNIERKTIEKLKENGVKLIFFNNTAPYFPENKEITQSLDGVENKFLSPNSLRYILYYLFLLKHNTYSEVMFSDIRDVVFQKDPFDYPKERGLYCFLEDVETKIKDEKHNSYWIKFGFGEETLQQIGGNTICCSGVTIGDYSSVMDYLQKMINHIRSIDNVGGLDQGIHNYLIYTNQLEQAVLVGDDEGPVTTLSYFKPYAKIRFNKEGQIINKNGNLVNIVHQYDRHLSLLRQYNYNGYLHEVLNLFKRKLVNIRNVISGR